MAINITPEGLQSVPENYKPSLIPKIKKGGGGGSSYYEPPPSKPQAPQAPVITEGVKLAQERQQAGQPLTDANKIALQNYNLRNYAYGKGINLTDIKTDVQAQNLIKQYNQNVAQKQAVQTQNIATTSAQKLPSGEVHAVATGQALRNYIYQKTGISLPSAKQTFNYFYSGTEYGEPQQEVTIGRVLATPVRVIGRATAQLGGLTSEAIELTGYKGKSMEKTISYAYQTKGTESKLPQEPLKVKYDLLSPKDIGKAVTIGADIALLSKVPLPLFAVSSTASGVQGIKEKDYLGGALQIGLGGIAGASYLLKPVSFAVKPQVIRRELPSGLILEREIPKVKYQAMDTIQPVIQSEQSFSLGKFELTQTIPPRYEYMPQSRLGKLFFSPEIAQLTKPRVNIVKTLTPLVITQEGATKPSTIISFRRGGSYGTISRLSGGQAEIDLKNLASLPKETQLGLRLISEGGAVKFLNPNDLYSMGEATIRKVLRLNYKTGGKYLFEGGSKRLIGASASQAKLLISAPEYDIFKTTTGLRDISRPTMKFREGGTIIEGYSKVFKEPINLDFEQSYILPKTTSPAGARTLLDNQARQFMENVKAGAVKLFPKIRTPKLSVKSVTEPPVTLTGLPAGKSLYEGRGIYEQTENLITLPKNLQADIQTPKEITQQAFRLKNIETPAFKPIEILRQPLSFRERQKEIRDEQLNLRQGMKVKQLQKQVFQQGLMFQTKLITQPPKPNIPIRPRIAGGFLTTPQRQMPKWLRAKPQNRYTAVSRRYGKPLIVGTGKTLSEAYYKGFGFVRRTLGASLKVLQNGRAVKLPSNRFFQQSKRNPFMLVQRKGGALPSGRLSSYGERAEIKRLRAMKFKPIKIKSMRGFRFG